MRFLQQQNPIDNDAKNGKSSYGVWDLLKIISHKK